MAAPPQVLEKPVREYLHKRGEPIKQEMRLQDRDDGLVRMSMMAAARDQYDDLPDVVTQWYDPNSNCLIIPLPEPDTAPEEAQQTLSIGNQSSQCEDGRE